MLSREISRHQITKVHRHQDKEFILKVMETLEYFHHMDNMMRFIVVKGHPACSWEIRLKLNKTRAKKLVKDMATWAFPHYSTHKQKVPAIDQAECEVLTHKDKEDLIVKGLGSSTRPGFKYGSRFVPPAVQPGANSLGSLCLNFLIYRV